MFATMVSKGCTEVILNLTRSSLRGCKLIASSSLLIRRAPGPGSQATIHSKIKADPATQTGPQKNLNFPQISQKMPQNGPKNATKWPKNGQK